MGPVQDCYVLHTLSFGASMETFSAYDVLNLVNDSDDDDSIHCDAMSKSDFGNRSN